MKHPKGLSAHCGDGETNQDEGGGGSKHENREGKPTQKKGKRVEEKEGKREEGDGKKRGVKKKNMGFVSLGGTGRDDISMLFASFRPC